MQEYDFDTLLKTCEDEKLHLSGMIQNFGALIVVNKKDKTITHVSENINKFLDFEVEQLLSKSIKIFFPLWLELFKSLEEDKNLKENFIYKKIKEEDLYLKISKSTNSYIIDIQKLNDDTSHENFKSDNYNLFITPDTKEGYDEYLELYMDTVFEIISFDRIMLYQFQEDWSGKVIKERRSSEAYGSYLDLRFPASDIPKIARDLYMLNPSRTIANVQSPNINIVSLDSSIPDLTYSDTRSVSPMHIEYLKNMGVKSSFSIAIIISGELWGLLACHNFSVKILDPISINNAIKQSNLFSLGIQNYFAKEKINSFDLIQHRINDIIDLVISSSNYEKEILEHKSYFLELIKSDGFAFVIGDKVIAFGNLPNNESFINIDQIFLKDLNNILATNSIYEEILKESSYLGPAGVLAVKQRYGNKIIRCYWFRSEFIEELHWAGNPNKPKIENVNALSLSPRRSFEKFIEIKRNFSKNFDGVDYSTALKFSNVLFKYLSKEI